MSKGGNENTSSCCLPHQIQERLWGTVFDKVVVVPDRGRYKLCWGANGYSMHDFYFKLAVVCSC